MFAPSAYTFANIISGAIRLGREAFQAKVLRDVREQDLEVLIPAEMPLTPRENDPPGGVAQRQRNWCSAWVRQKGTWAEGQPYAGVFKMRNGQLELNEFTEQPIIDPDHAHLLDDALEELIIESRLRAGGDVDSQRAHAQLMCYHHKNWADENASSPWGLFFAEVVDTGFDLLKNNPGLLSGGGKAHALFRAMAPNLADAFSANDNGVRTSTKLANAFAEASLTTLVNSPDLVASEDHWKPLVHGVLKPLQQEVQVSGASVLFSAEGRLRELMTGPIAHNALSAIADQHQGFLKGALGEERILGEIARQTLGVVASTDPKTFHARKIFSAEGAAVVFKSALSVASERPELFALKSLTGAGQSAMGEFVRNIANTITDAPRPFGARDGLAPAVASAALKGAEVYAATHFRTPDGEEPELGVKVAQHLVSDVLSGFKGALGQGDQNLFANLFSRSEALDVLQIVMEHVAQSPNLSFGMNANRAAKSVASTLATAIATDKAGLLSGSDWRSILVVAMRTELKNPGSLLSDTSEGKEPERTVAVKLIKRLIDASLKSKAPGGVMFGETLSEAIRATLHAAGAGALSAFENDADFDNHLTGLDTLVARLNSLAASRNAATAISADDWVTIYTHFLAHGLAAGAGAFDEVSDDDLMAALTAPIPIARI
ncbi:MAG: hypothetical protein KTR21_06935 [Rhodobacteraceae bacterium]|nr:hypothetical protein [Paracoccaceae bacterium]